MASGSDSLNLFDELDCLIAERRFSDSVNILEKELANPEKQKCIHRFVIYLT